MYRRDFRYLILSLHKSENTVNSQKKLKCICVRVYIYIALILQQI